MTSFRRRSGAACSNLRLRSASFRHIFPAASRRCGAIWRSSYRAASGAGLYTNLITQGTFLDDTLLDSLLESGLDHVQISIQAPETGAADRIAGAVVHERKLDALARVRERDSR